jgi:hypothetical protein
MLKKILIASVLASAFGAVPLVASAQTIVITQPPPPMRVERMPAPRRGYEWAPGHWAWRHGQHVWVAGYWVRERPGQHWVADRWIQRNGRWEYLAGHWERGTRMGARGMGDHDHDGIPNRYDRDRDNDGVPNRYDSSPNNPYRR